MPYAVAIDDLPNWRECRDCGLMQKLPEVPDGEAAICIRCDATLRRASTHGLPFARLNAVAAAFLFPLALALPLGKVHILGRTSVASVFSGAEMMHHYGLLPLAVIVVLTLVVMPAMKLIVELTVLIGLFAVRPPRWLAWLFGWLEHISPWAMVEVFVLGSIVAYSRLSAMAVVNVGLAAFALGGTMVAMLTTDATLDYEAIWQRLEGGAPAGAGGTRLTSPGLIGCMECRRVAHANEGDRCPRCSHSMKGHPEKQPGAVAVTQVNKPMPAAKNDKAPKALRDDVSWVPGDYYWGGATGIGMMGIGSINLGRGPFGFRATGPDAGGVGHGSRAIGFRGVALPGVLLKIQGDGSTPAWVTTGSRAVRAASSEVAKVGPS